jgi:hypothetical protein
MQMQMQYPVHRMLHSSRWPCHTVMTGNRQDQVRSDRRSEAPVASVADAGKTEAPEIPLPHDDRILVGRRFRVAVPQSPCTMLPRD